MNGSFLKNQAFLLLAGWKQMDWASARALQTEGWLMAIYLQLGICQKNLEYANTHILSFRHLNKGNFIHVYGIVGLENTRILKCLKGQTKLALMAKIFTGPRFHPWYMTNFSEFGSCLQVPDHNISYDLYALSFYGTCIHFISYIITLNAKQCIFYCLYKLHSYNDLFGMYFLEKQQNFIQFKKKSNTNPLKLSCSDLVEYFPRKTNGTFLSIYSFKILIWKAE